jgi:hypothetical protein
LNDSMYPFSQGLPGSMKSVFTPTLPSHALTAFAANCHWRTIAATPAISASCPIADIRHAAIRSPHYSPVCA